MPAYSVEQLRKLIGLEVMYQGVCCRIVEILEHEQALVLEASGPREGIQDNQYGDPHRRVARVFTIPLEECDADGRADAKALGLPLK